MYQSRTIPMLCLIFVFACMATFAYAGDLLTPFPPGSQDPATLNSGLAASEYGYHPDDNGSWGESWYMLANNDAGDQVWVLLSVSNYNPFHHFAGTVDLFYYPKNGKPAKGHSEFKSKEIQADLKRLQVNIGGNTIEGTHPTYRIKAKSKGLALDLTYEAQTPDFLLGQGDVKFGKKQEEYWKVAVIAPRAKVSGTVTVDGKAIPFNGMGYFDHGRSNIKVPAFSKWWYVIRILDKDFSLGAMSVITKDNFEPDGFDVVHLTLGDKVIANSGSLDLDPSEEVAHKESEISWPSEYEIKYENGDVKLHGKVKLTDMVAGFNVLDSLSPFVRGMVKAFYTDPWQFRYRGVADLTLEIGEEERKIKSPVIAEVHHYK